MRFRLGIGSWDKGMVVGLSGRVAVGSVPWVFVSLCNHLQCQSCGGHSIQVHRRGWGLIFGTWIRGANMGGKRGTGNWDFNWGQGNKGRFGVGTRADLQDVRSELVSCHAISALCACVFARCCGMPQDVAISISWIGSFFCDTRCTDGQDTIDLLLLLHV